MLLTAKAHQNQIKKKHTGSKRHLGQEDIYQEIVTYLKDKKERKEQRDERNDPDEVIGRMVATELKSFPEDKKFLNKHQINQIIYNQHVSLQKGHSSTSESPFSVLEADLAYSQLKTTIIERENKPPQPMFN